MKKLFIVYGFNNGKILDSIPRNNDVFNINNNQPNLIKKYKSILESREQTIKVYDYVFLLNEPLKFIINEILGDGMIMVQKDLPFCDNINSSAYVNKEKRKNKKTYSSELIGGDSESFMDFIQLLLHRTKLDQPILLEEHNYINNILVDDPPNHIINFIPVTLDYMYIPEDITNKLIKKFEIK